MKMDLPEERLLRLIKGKDKKQDKPARGYAKNILMKNKIIKASFLPPLNRILTITIIILGGYFIYSLIFPAETDIKPVTEGEALSLPNGDASGLERSLLPEKPDYSAYSKEIEKKDLFGPSFFTEGPKKEKTSGTDVSKRFSLVGIIAGENPQAIIEDKDTEKTHYLYKGQSINGVTVEDIGEGRVVLDYAGEEIVLVL